MDSLLKVDVFAIDAAHDAVGNTPVTAPQPFTLTENTDLVDDLAAVGITLGAENPFESAWMEAEASIFLKRAAECDAETDRLKAAMTKQIEVITEHYGRRIVQEQRRYAECVRMVEYLASIAAYPKKRKSFDTPFGTFGKRDKAATVELADASALLDWAKVHRPEHVRATLASTLADPTMAEAVATGQDVKLSPEWGALKKTLDAQGELPPGVAKVEARTEFYAAPRLPITVEDAQS